MNWRCVSMQILERGVRAFMRGALLAVLAAMLGACSMFDKDNVAPDEPADKLYNEGLYLLNTKKDPKEAAPTTSPALTTSASAPRNAT